MNIRENIKGNYGYILILSLGFFGVGYLKGFDTVFFLLVFLVVFFFNCYSFVGAYNLFRGTSEKDIISRIVITVILNVITYLKYNIHTLLRILSFSLIISTVIVFYVILTKGRNK